MKRAGAAALTVAAALFLMGQASRTNTVAASQFILKDAIGKVRATLSTDEKLGNSGSAQLVLYDGDGKQRVKLESGALAFTGARRVPFGIAKEFSISVGT